MNKITYILLSIMAMLTVSCSDETLNFSHSSDASPLVIYASINGTGQATNRAITMQIDDLWSYVDFTDKDVMGFYSSGGNWTENNGKGDFDNLALQYDAGSKKFTDLTNGVDFSPSNMNGSEIFMYFPYEKNMNDTGLKLRQETADNDTLRCIDFLSSNSISLQGVIDGENVALYGEFKHTFGELIILRGEGFDNPPEDKRQITVVLSEPYTNIKVNLNTEDGNWSCTPQLVFNKESELTQEEACKWTAWWGRNYGITENGQENEENPGQPAWYVIVPTLPNQFSTVQYIELWDNEGHLQRVSSLKLHGGNTKLVAPGWRYPMEITMKELVPTVNPFPIIPWNQEDINLTDQRERGINNIAEFANWVLDYNNYLKDENAEEKINALLKYGDLTEGDPKKWHFYILSNLDFTSYSPRLDNQTMDVIIPELKDILDGTSTTFINGKFANHTITGLDKTFIGKLERNGSLQNFDFINPNVQNEESTAPAGIIVNTMYGADTSVLNCNISNGDLYNPKGPAGMIVGSMTDGTIKNCTLSGSLFANSIADEDAAKIAGETAGNPIFLDNDADAVVSNKDFN